MNARSKSNGKTASDPAPQPLSSQAPFDSRAATDPQGRVLLDEASQRILQRLILQRNQAEANLRQAEAQFKNSDIDVSNYAQQILKAHGLDPQTHVITPDLAAIIPRPPEAKS